MVQMSPADQAVVKALPGNDQCADCGMKNPQWASGGNKNCNDYLKVKGIDPRTPIKAKYESEAAQLYKEVLKARVEGRPEPTILPPPKPRVGGGSSAPSAMNGIMTGGSSSTAGDGDPNGMERLAGESDQHYIARQTRLKEEARARMQAKFGSSGSRLSGVGSSSMQGIGSNPNYNPTSGYGGGPDLDSMVNSVSGAFSSGMSFVSSVVNDESTKATMSNLGSTASIYTGSFWSTLKNTVNDVATSITQPDVDSGLSSFQREMHSHVPSQSKYAGFGSNSVAGGGSGAFGELPGIKQSATKSTTLQDRGNIGSNILEGMGGGVPEATGLPGEDRNGVERLTGETDEQYVMRQTRLRDEAKARMAAKFGGGGLASVSSSSAPSYQSRPPSAPTSGSNVFGAMNGVSTSAAISPSSFPVGMSLSKKPVPAPASGNSISSFPRPGGMTPQRKDSKESIYGDDFFASFGT